MIEDIKNIIVKDVFDKKEIEDIYDYINQTPSDLYFFHPKLGHKVFMTGMPQHIQDKVTKVAQEFTKTKLKLTEISAARYCNHYSVPPNLYPHFDLFESPRMTLDIQLKSTRKWDIYVEKNAFTLNDNEALIFYGTNQIHWREKTIFKDDDFLDMLFCHFSEDAEDPYVNPPEFREEMLKRESVLLKEYGEDNAK